MLMGEQKLFEPDVKRLQRSSGTGRIEAKWLAGRSRIARLYQEGSAKVRVPSVHSDALEAVLINTSGGLTGGDVISWDVTAHKGAQMVATTQACEKVYRAAEGAAEVRTRLQVGEEAALCWVPQETILFDGSALDRRLNVDLSQDARVLIVEPVILGRTGMGEQVRVAQFSDQWRVRREGKLIHAEATRMSDDFSRYHNSAAGLGRALAYATLLYCGADAEVRSHKLAAHLPSDVAMSCWADKVVVRLLAETGYELRKRVLPIIDALAVAPLPRIWTS